MDYLKILNKNYDVLIDDTYDNLIRCPEKRPVRFGERTSYLTPVNDRDVIPTQFVDEPYPYLKSRRQTYFNIDFKVAKIFHRVYSLSRYTPYPLVGVKIPKGYRWRASWCVLPPEQQSAVLTVYIKKVNGDRITEEEMIKLTTQFLKESVNEKLNDPNLRYFEETFDIVYVKHNDNWEMQESPQFSKAMFFNLNFNSLTQN